MSCFKIDGIEFTKAVVSNPERSFSITDGENAGRLITTAKMERDVLGTFYNYSIVIDHSFMSDEEYSELYELISAPVDSHILEVPYNKETLVFDAYITSGKDKLLGIRKDKNIWSELSLNFIAMAPQRRPS